MRAVCTICILYDKLQLHFAKTKPIHMTNTAYKISYRHKHCYFTRTNKHAHTLPTSETTKSVKLEDEEVINMSK